MQNHISDEKSLKKTMEPQCNSGETLIEPAQMPSESPSVNLIELRFRVWGVKA